MEMVGYMFDGMEIPTVQFIEMLEELRSKYISFGIGVYTDQMFKNLYGRAPIKPYEERVRLAAAFKGVDFTFPVSKFDNRGWEKEVLNITEETQEEGAKPYHVGYAPGTYDLLHEGHIEHLTFCRRMCDILVVGVKTDKNVFETKGKYTYQPEELRKRIIENLAIVDHVIYVETRNKRIANQIVKDMIGELIDVVFLGSDCIGQENDQNPDNLQFVYTDRPEEVMKTRSSSYYREKLREMNENLK